MILIKIAVAGFALGMLAGCASGGATSGQGEGSLGLSERLEARQARYCRETSPWVRASLLAVIRSQVPGYPVSGLCTDAEQALAKEIAERLEELGPEAQIDFEQAVEDQLRFQEEVGEGVNDGSEDTAAAVD